MQVQLLLSRTFLRHTLVSCTFLLEKQAKLRIIGSMSHVICAIISAPDGVSSAKDCLNSLSQMPVRPSVTLLISNAPLSEEKKNSFCRKYENIGLLFPSCPEINSWRSAFEFAFRSKQVDYVWILDSRCRVSPTALETLLPSSSVPLESISISTLTDSRNPEQFSRPIFIESGKRSFTPYKSCLYKKDVPTGRNDCYLYSAGWIGALYPRHAFLKLGTPEESFTLNNNNDEYTWKAKLAGFRLILKPDSEIFHPSFSQLIHYNIAGRSFFYEHGISPELQYYKTRNWAWIQRLRNPHKHILRLIFCALYAILTINAMLKCNELSIKGIYNTFRALHNGFYGKLRPYSPRKN